MTSNEQINCILKGEIPDYTPLHARPRMIPTGDEGEKIKDLGWSIGASNPTYSIQYIDIDIEKHHFEEKGQAYVKMTYHTPKGDLSTVSQVYQHGGLYNVEHIFKDVKDYVSLLALIESIKYIPSYHDYSNLEEKIGDTGYVWAWLGYDPMHEIMVKMMSVERFSYEWMDNRKNILELYEILFQKHKEMYNIALDSPAQMIVYGGNIQSKIVSPKFFREYYMPTYMDIGEKLHDKGKLLGNHWDGAVGSLKDLIAQSPIDVLEGFCPPPDGDISIKEALAIWPDKILSMNFPSGLQYKSEDEITMAAKAFIDEAGSGRRFMISLTEDFPLDYTNKLFVGIAKAIKKYR